MWNDWAGLGVILLVGFVIFIFWACKADTSSCDKWLSAILDKELVSALNAQLNFPVKYRIKHATFPLKPIVL